jgi:acyl-CoA reductase-like NAD-dependent aldehyde dehydrogenase
MRPAARARAAEKVMAMQRVDLSGTPWGPIVDSRWTDAGVEGSFVVLNPATGSPLAEVRDSTEATVDVAVAASRAAFPGWRSRSPRERAQLLRGVATVIRAHSEELAELESLENGKPARDALAFDVTYAHLTFDYFGGLAETVTGTLLQQGAIDAHIIPEPYGVIGAILPFNWPPIHFAAKVAPALATGNTIIIKPGEQAPLTVLRMVELANSVLPAGVLSAVTGVQGGIALSAHPGVDRLSFTGAPDTGRKIMASAAPNLTPSTMELGGKNALLVFPDADLDNALTHAIDGMYFNQGEACTSTARILVHDDVHDEFLARFAAATERLVVGEGIDPSTDLGPMVDQKQQARVLSYIDIAKAEGARLVTQGDIPSEERLSGGFWVRPTVFADVTHDMRVAREEVFGPVATFLRFSTEDEALRIANGTEFGLTAAVFTADLARAKRLAAGLEVGMVFINNYFRASLLGSPFGGVKASGFGREGAEETLRDYVRSKNVRYPSGLRPVPEWVSAARVTKGASEKR